MTDNNRTDELDTVLFAFHRAFNRPTANQINEWTQRYPDFAKDIREHAEILQEWMVRETESTEDPSESLLARGRSTALNALHDVQMSASAADATAPLLTFEHIIAARGTNIPAIARALNIGRDVLSALINGRMRMPAGERLVVAFMSLLSITRDAFCAAHRAALNSPRLGLAKATQLPSDIARSYEEIIRSSSNTAPERQRYYLGDD
jgi:hypothetical protein